MDISGSDVRAEHSPKIHLIFVTFLVFHLDISGNDTNESKFAK